MRSSLLYLVAAFAPIVWSASVSPLLRGAGRRLVQVALALVLAKPAISLTLVVGVKLLANAGTATAGTKTDGAAALGTLVSGFACFAIAGLSPWVVYRLLPAVEGAAVSSGIVGGWGRAGMTAVQAGVMVKSFGATVAASAATRALPSQLGSAGASAAPATGGAPSPGAETSSRASIPTSKATARSAGPTAANAPRAPRPRPSPAPPPVPDERGEASLLADDDDGVQR
jgi:hypothetical protein